MARSVRQSKIIEIISNNEIETQDELVNALKDAGFDITQATISRDIKELGLIKIVGNSKKYKYAFIDSEDRVCNNKSISIFKEVTIWIKPVGNLLVLKTVKGTSQLVSSFVDKMAIDGMLGCVHGDDTVMVIAENSAIISTINTRLNDILNS